jgi:hypothetical protein
LFAVVPETVAVKGSVPFVIEVAEPGAMATELTVAGAAVTVIVAEADLVGSATLVAVMMCVPGLGAV